MNNKNKLLAILGLIAEQSGEKASESRLEFLLSSLSAYEPEKIERGLKKIMETARRFPTLGEIKQAMGVAAPTELDAALRLANEIIAAIGKLGEVPGESRTAKTIPHVLGPTAYAIVQTFGGWNKIVQLAGEGEGILRAQLRDSIKSGIQTGRFDISAIDQPKLSPRDALTQLETDQDRKERKQLQEQQPKPLQICGKAQDDEKRRRLIAEMFRRVTGREADPQKIPMASLETFGSRLKTFEREGLVDKLQCVSDVLRPDLAIELARKAFQ